MQSTFSPIAIFTYKRLDSLRHAIAALKTAQLSSECDVFIFSDGAKGSPDIEAINEVRAYISNIDGFKSINYFFSETNQGLANSIINGVTTIINKYGSIIVLEDDLIVSDNFIVYMNEALKFYKDNPTVFSIAGYSIPVKAPSDYLVDVYFTPRASSWGWATWKDRWLDVDWKVSDYDDFKQNKKEILNFNKGGKDLAAMLAKQMNGKINSWAIRYCYHQFKQGTLTVYPVISKINNIGFNEQATHSNVFDRYSTPLDKSSKTIFKFPSKVFVNPILLSQFQNFYSYKTRILGKLKTYLYKMGFLKNNVNKNINEI